MEYRGLDVASGISCGENGKILSANQRGIPLYAFLRWQDENSAAVLILHNFHRCTEVDANMFGFRRGKEQSFIVVGTDREHPT